MRSHFIDDSTVMGQFNYQVGSYSTIIGQPTLKNSSIFILVFGIINTNDKEEN